MFHDSFGPAPDRAVRGLWFVIAGAVALFLVDLLLVTQGTITTRESSWILSIHAHSSATLDRIMRAITNTGGVWRAVPVACATVFLWVTKRRLEAMTFLVAIVIAQSTTYALKALVQRDRPGLFDVANMPTDSSFPSGHALGSTVLGGLAAMWLWQHRHRALAIAAVIWAIMVSFSRVYFGLHYPTDVIASLALGIAFVAATGLAYHHLHLRHLPASDGPRASNDRSSVDLDHIQDPSVSRSVDRVGR